MVYSSGGFRGGGGIASPFRPKFTIQCYTKNQNLKPKIRDFFLGGGGLLFREVPPFLKFLDPPLNTSIIKSQKSQHLENISKFCDSQLILNPKVKNHNTLKTLRTGSQFFRFYPKDRLVR
jgi:hypothetical protein